LLLVALFSELVHLLYHGLALPMRLLPTRDDFLHQLFLLVQLFLKLLGNIFVDIPLPSEDVNLISDLLVRGVCLVVFLQRVF
jgi:hypothetical protein